jgi:hypothetical protein
MRIRGSIPTRLRMPAAKRFRACLVLIADASRIRAIVLWWRLARHRVAYAASAGAPDAPGRYDVRDHAAAAVERACELDRVD